MMARILIVDDEEEVADLLELFLKNDGFEVYKFYESPKALAFLEKQEVDLAILDIMMPDMDGFALCRRIREKYLFPIIMLTARVENTDKITGLLQGADDYITKPFQSLEVVARVKTQLRRYKNYNPRVSMGREFPKGSGDVRCLTEEGDSLEHSGRESAVAEDTKGRQRGNAQKEEPDFCDIRGLYIDRMAHQCRLYDKQLELTPTEFEILWLLCSRQGQVVGSEELFRLVWGEKYYDNNNTVMKHIGKIREKLRENYKNPKFIKTVWGIGYTIEK
ncbi:MAG: response regulator transcription factor [Roseburia sp.]|nr:response regulator transcription factor [Roseburia sp.]